jgi:hypothetical protein
MTELYAEMTHRWHKTSLTIGHRWAYSAKRFQIVIRVVVSMWKYVVE